MNRIRAIVHDLIDVARSRIALIVATIALAASGQARAQWSSLPGGGIDMRARAAIVHDDGSGTAVFVGGRFSQAGGLPVNNIAKWDGKQWSALGTGLTVSGGDGWVLAMATYDDGLGGGSQLYAGGAFNMAGGVAARGVARWDGRAWHALPIPFEGVANVYCMTVYDDGSGPALYIGGRFTIVAGHPARSLIKWDGVACSEVGGGVTRANSTFAYVMDLTVFDDGSGLGLAVGGWFNRVGGNSIVGLARWRSNSWSTIGGNVTVFSQDGEVSALVPWPGEFGPGLICQGVYSQIGGVAMNYLARWDGQSWSGIAPTNIAFSGGRLRVAHTSDACPELFAYFGDNTGFSLLRWNGHRWRSLDDAAYTGGWQFSPGGLASIPYLDMVEFNDQLIVTGSFTQVAGQPAPGVAVWGLDALHPCDADITGDYIINVSDLLAVITSWGICIDCPTDQVPCGGDGQVNVTDLLMVITHWGACP